MVLTGGEAIGGDLIHVGDGVVRVGDGGVERALWSAREPRRGDRIAELLEHLARSRLAATVVRPERPTAIFELPSGDFAAVTIDRARVEVVGPIDLLIEEHAALAPPIEVKPGQVLYETADPGAPPQRTSLALAARP
jgi:hypothetical protein